MRIEDSGGGIGALLRQALKALFQSPLERERAFYQRYRQLSEKIEAAPEDMLHYVLRGELNLQRGEYARAKTDFEAGLALLENLDETQGWLILEQVMQDRALYGLRQAQSQLPPPDSAANITMKVEA